MWSSKDVYYISDGTGILATNLGQSLLCQFPEINFHEEHFPFIRSAGEAKKTISYILKQSVGRRPIIFSTIMNREIIAIFDRPEVEFFDGYDFFLSKLERVLEAKSLRVPGFSRHIDNVSMAKRVEAIHFSLEHDDGIKADELDQADCILVGVSRSGKTPISMYLATQIGLKSANFPLTSEHLSSDRLPEHIIRNHKRTIGLTTTAEILHKMREKRLPNSNYAKLATCIQELNLARDLFFRAKIPTINTAGKSIEEVSTEVLQELGISKRPPQANNAIKSDPDTANA